MSATGGRTGTKRGGGGRGAAAPGAGTRDRRGPGREEPAERRILRMVAWMMERTEPFTRGDLVAAVPREYAGGAEAVQKKFQRDKAAAERLGVAVRNVDGDPTVYLVDRSALHLARLAFEPAEAAVLWMAGRAGLRAADHPLRPDLEAALRKLTIGAKGLPAVAPGPGGLPPPASGDELAERLHLLAEAVQRRRRLHLVYRGGGGEETTRDVDVHGYGLRRGEWFFVGHCHLRGASRLFYLRRVVKLLDRKVAAAGHACAVPKDAKGGDYQVPSGFDLDAWRAQQPWDYLAHPPVAATVRLGGPLARGARALLPGAELSAAPDGARLATLQVRDLDGLVRQVLAWGEHAELLSPPEGRARAREILDAVGGRLAGEVAP
ncbi:MAG TPA: WYL domain-containing protein [Anaeromyxobacteraceae bacterium]|nr:WYL domain-containing protein [Anaeromyxobacteraceae bacterium]